MPLAEIPRLDVQVAGAFGAFDRRAGNVGNRPQVLIRVALVDCQVVDPCLLEMDPGVLLGVELGGDPFLVAEHHLLDSLHGQPARCLGVGEHDAHLRELLLHVALISVGSDGDPLERGAGHQHGVPVVAGGACDEPSALLAGEVAAGGGQYPRLGVKLQELPTELFQHVLSVAHLGVSLTSF